MDAGYFSGQVARTAHDEQNFFATAPGGSRLCGGCWTTSPKTTGPMPSRWTMPSHRGRLPAGLVAGENLAADPPGPPRAGAGLPPARGPAAPHPAPSQRALPIGGLTAVGAIYGYSFVRHEAPLTNRGWKNSASGLSQQAGEAEGSLTVGTRGRVGAALTTTGRAGTARRRGSGKQDGDAVREPVSEAP